MLPAPPEEHYAFASFRLYPGQRTLLRDGKPVIIGGRAYDVLLLLVTQAGIVVSLKELMCFVWPNVTVDEANLRVQMGCSGKSFLSATRPDVRSTRSPPAATASSCPSDTIRATSQRMRRCARLIRCCRFC